MDTQILEYDQNIFIQIHYFYVYKVLFKNHFLIEFKFLIFNNSTLFIFNQNTTKFDTHLKSPI
jgi:hypothetical protein